ncbi:MAG: hypothetical protein A2X34_03895 [Elusimicrobia bacterium GWC2_51_8]|nr:MAG: hypothetical protein A2X33_08400 [Elusimicrobia bacterium GWA2_51_34]OGR58947.1 MAG: hypothetical protein A2X34_03895 [Elusimicrobia bacterium GWC2_51_8]OGR86259.1 MAG: hypothetical protein A2021_04435 [Elusimicrobia bacterium GWF2_52_66]HAF95261.1 hypothetical protein [Elusimicrobiota bacterium]HCE97339.1 hypothetical protein [Elusimicrobiota bacterium]
MGCIYKTAFAFILLGQTVSGFSQTPEEFVKRAQDAPDSNRRVIIYGEALNKYPADSRFYHKRGIAYGIMEYHDKAFKDFDKAIALDSSAPAYYQDRGLALHRLKRNEEAIADFTKVIELEPGNARAYYLRAVSYINLKQLDKAEPDLDKAIQLDPKLKNDSAARQIRGLISSKKPFISVGTKPEPAQESAAENKPAASAAVPAAAGPKNKPELTGAKSKGLAIKAGVRANLKKYDEAAQAWGELLELEPGYYPAYAERAYAFAMSGENEKAGADFNKAFKADPDQARAYLLRGAAACAAGDFSAASADLDKALALDPKIKREFLYSSTKNSTKSNKPCK